MIFSKFYNEMVKKKPFLLHKLLLPCIYKKIIRVIGNGFNIEKEPITADSITITLI